MTSDSQSQNQQAQGSQSQTRKTEKPRSPLKRLGEALGNFLLKHQIEKDLNEKLNEKLNDIIELQRIKDLAEKEMKSKVDKTVEKVKKNLQEEIVHDLKKEYEELKGKYEKLKDSTSRLNITLVILGGFAVILLTIGNPVISRIFSLDVLELDIKTLKEDVEDLRENQMQN